MKRYADACTGRDQPDVVNPAKRPLAVVQLVHAGRQSMRGSGRKITEPALAPSAVPMSTMGGLGPIGKFIDHLMWGSVAAMTTDQVEQLRDRFVQAALICAEAGFDGVELHGSHGYQIAAFLSPRTNFRTDKYGGSAENRARLMLEIVDALRKQVKDDFIIGVKLNSSDYVQGGLTEEDALQNVKWLAETGDVDLSRSAVATTRTLRSSWMVSTRRMRRQRWRSSLARPRLLLRRAIQSYCYRRCYCSRLRC